MSFSYDADLELAAHVIASLTSVEDHLDEVVTDLRWRVARLHETWGGLAAVGHIEAHASWHSSYVEMRRALADMRSAVRTAALNYSTAAEDNTSMWSAVR